MFVLKRKFRKVMGIRMYYYIAETVYVKGKPKHKILLAAKYSLEEMRVYLQLDSLAFLSLNGLYRAVHGVPRNAAIPQGCDACFTGDYPTALPDLGR